MVLNTPGFACVYWIHKAEHKDHLTEGYIGVSCNPARRWKEHLRDAKGGYHPNNFLSHNIIKYEDTLIYEVMFAGTINQCYEYEKELRPKASIGWNLMGGGKIGTISEEARERIRIASKNRKPLTETQKWKRYNHRYKTTLTFLEYRDMIAIKEGKMPPSKANLRVFHISEVKEYANIEEAAIANDYEIWHMLDICESKVKDFIYMKDL